MADFPLVLATAILGFGLPMRGSYLVLFIAGLTFVGTTVSIGILISTVARTQQQAMMASFLFLFPALQLSGILFPVENMPLVLRVTAYLDPLKYFIELIRNIMLKGGDTVFVAQNLGALAVMAVVAILLTFNRFKRTLN
jgi:ABC-2 type transport system permease protein